MSGNLGDIVYHKVTDWLRQSGLVANARLPSETVMARHFGVSRPVLRQALARLQAERRLVARKGSGRFVLEPAPAAPVPAFDALASIPDVRSFLEFRCSLEGEIAAHAARARNDHQLAAIAQRRRAMEQAVAANLPAIDEDIALHAAVAEATGNRFFAATLAALEAQTRFGIRLTRELATRPAADRRREIQAEHAAIHEAVAAGHPGDARDAMVAHLRGGIRRLFDQAATG